MITATVTIIFVQFVAIGIEGATTWNTSRYFPNPNTTTSYFYHVEWDGNVSSYHSSQDNCLSICFWFACKYLYSLNLWKKQNYIEKISKLITHSFDAITALIYCNWTSITCAHSYQRSIYKWLFLLNLHLLFLKHESACAILTWALIYFQPS